MHHRITACLGGLILAFGAMPSTPYATSPFSALPAYAQDQSETQLRSLQDMLSWMQEANTVIVSANQAFDAETLNELFYLISQDPIDVDALTTQRNKFEANGKVGIAQGRLLFEQLEAPEKWDIGGGRSGTMERGIYEGALEQYAGLSQTLDDFETVSSRIIEIVDAVISEDIDFDLNLFEQELSTVSQRMIEGENRMVNSFIKALPKSSPNYWYHRILYATNRVVLEETEILAATIEMDPDRSLNMRQAVGRAMLKESTKIDSYLRRGEASIGTSVDAIERYVKISKNDEEKAMLRGAIKANASFRNVFDIEERIHELQTETATLYASDAASSDIDPIISENDAEFQMLVQERMNLQMQRLEMVNP